MTSLKIKNKVSATERQMKRIAAAYKEGYDLGVTNTLSNFDPGTHKLTPKATEFLAIHQKAEAEHGDKRLAFILGQVLLWHGQE